MTQLMPLAGPLSFSVTAVFAGELKQGQANYCSLGKGRGRKLTCCVSHRTLPLVLPMMTGSLQLGAQQPYIPEHLRHLVRIPALTISSWLAISLQSVLLDTQNIQGSEASQTNTWGVQI